VDDPSERDQEANHPEKASHVEANHEEHPAGVPILSLRMRGGEEASGHTARANGGIHTHAHTHTLSHTLTYTLSPLSINPQLPASFPPTCG
jgi:hypothetical protein